MAPPLNGYSESLPAYRPRSARWKAYFSCNGITCSEHSDWPCYPQSYPRYLWITYSDTFRSSGVTTPVATVLADSLIASLPVGLPGLFNPWRESCPFETTSNRPTDRRNRLVAHLSCNPSLILVGEAPGYQGCRYSGIPFTSERLLLEGGIPRIAVPAARLSTRPRPFSEPSATIVWKALYRLGVANKVVLWNAVQLHPYRPGQPWSNRTPTDAELALGRPALELLFKAYPDASVIAVGKKAGAMLRLIGAHAVSEVRHPANGGAVAFSSGLESIINRRGI